MGMHHRPDHRTKRVRGSFKKPVAHGTDHQLHCRLQQRGFAQGFTPLMAISVPIGHYEIHGLCFKIGLFLGKMFHDQ